MPPPRPTVCAHPGCPELTTNPRCPTHTHHADTQRPNAATRGYNARWQQERRRYLRAHPLCQWPRCHQPATDVDHQDGQGPLGPQGYDWDNLAAYCHPHHSRKTALHDGGYGNPRGGVPPPTRTGR